MCKNDMCESKCKACFDRGMSCCNELPVMTTEEVARIYYESKDLKEAKSTLVPVGPNHFVMAKAEDVKGLKVVDPTKYKCPLLTDEGKCMAYDYRPKICRDFGTNDGLPCYAKDLSIDDVYNISKDDLLHKRNEILPEIKKKAVSLAMVSKASTLDAYKHSVKVNNKYDADGVQNFKANTVLYYLMYGMEYITYSGFLDFLEIKYNYRLITFGDKGPVSALRDTKFNYTKNFSKNYCNVHNKVSTYLMKKPLEYHESLVARLNKLFKGSEGIVLDSGVNKNFINDEKISNNYLDFLLMVEMMLQITTTKKLPKHIKKYLKDDPKLIKEYRFMEYIAIKSLFNKPEDIEYYHAVSVDEVSLFKLKQSTDNELKVKEYISKLISVRLRDLTI